MFDAIALAKRRNGIILPRQLARQGVDFVLALSRDRGKIGPIAFEEGCRIGRPAAMDRPKARSSDGTRR
jgi:hypothetical protein